MGGMDGKICVVTGAAGSIGLASAKLFAAEGAHVMLVDHDAAQLAKARQSLTRAASPPAGCTWPTAE
jgi:NAD(P)-dependent dehydrogenase (short-subunit alcohol dehydrogenase family)